MSAYDWDAFYERVAAVGYEYEPKEEVHGCTLCGSSDIEPYLTEDNYQFPVGTDLCTHCGMVFINPRMDADAYQAFYEGWYRRLISAKNGREVTMATLRPEQELYAGWMCDSIGKHFPKYPRVLDVGGGCGAFVDEITNRYGGTGTVLDPAPDELKEGQWEKIRSTAEAWDPGYRRWNVITVMNTVDHFLDPVAVLTTCRRAMARSEDGAVLILNVQDFAYRCKVFSSHDMPVTRAVKVDHPHNFTRDTASALLRKTGFDPIEILKEEKPGHLAWCFVAKPSETTEEVRAHPELVKELRRYRDE